MHALGAPGSGKSTRARDLASGTNAVILATDDFWVVETVPGVTGYQWDGSRLREAHEWNQHRCRSHMSATSPTGIIIIDNTNVSRWEAKPYVQCAIEFNYSVRVEEPTTAWWIARDVQEMAARNQHHVSMDVIGKMIDRWDDTSTFTMENILLSERH
ncbi:NEDD4-binding protein 2 [Irineochytrium annulatum]|nr:NEDD4-binding protein 2 [Irineochytrium annulatum]